MFPTVRFLDKETGFDTSDMRRKLTLTAKGQSACFLYKFCN
ncbi:hypothetical protein APS_2492 [Acetobacter pasteurianus subsp. pasteurianus LMG 1262 = NBRC 106471]|nr:hypothetical protein APS_2492 [Acetobacter pasteurianus subsp. pasteurianus LMG 1262 = NBRC 106471]GCD50906.1 hypothetical protein NBRC106471_2462 [Acetobacter pasteurianus subsp. pasteurianus LMG 1262 = NBRC 106471]